MKPCIAEAKSLDGLPDATVIDGELVALSSDGRPNFNLLQNFRAAESHIMYYVWRLVHSEDGERSPRIATFIETMDCLPVTKVPEGPEWTYEVLCGRQHKISYVAQRFMWRSPLGGPEDVPARAEKGHITTRQTHQDQACEKSKALRSCDVFKGVDQISGRVDRQNVGVCSQQSGSEECGSRRSDLTELKVPDMNDLLRRLPNSGFRTLEHE